MGAIRRRGFPFSNCTACPLLLSMCACVGSQPAKVVESLTKVRYFPWTYEETVGNQIFFAFAP
ncbi:hypothetical protein LX36DRAFT_82648 [Colletotrichum falcatum]|nr:hypothetical protein LX36DRAFT_82648 [Colletotrichum falcatum]